jgi:hypothetical protein
LIRLRGLRECDDLLDPLDAALVRFGGGVIDRVGMVELVDDASGARAPRKRAERPRGIMTGAPSTGLELIG